MSSRTRLLVGVLLGAALLVVAVRGVDWQAVVTALRGARPMDLLLALASVLAYVVAKALRWRFLIGPVATVRTRQLLPAVFAGNAGNSLVPHAGEFVRALVAQRVVSARMSTLMATIAVERILDFIALLLIAMAMLLPLGAMTEQATTATVIVGLLGGAILAVAMFLSLRTEQCLAWTERCLSGLGSALRMRILREARTGAEGLVSLRQPRLLAIVLLLSLLQWLLIGATIQFSLHSVGVVSGPAAVTSVLLLSVVGMTLPTAPGYIGTAQAAFVLALAAFSVDPADAVAASVVYNFFVVVPALLIGLPYLHRHSRDMIRQRGGDSA